MIAEILFDRRVEVQISHPDWREQLTRVSAFIGDGKLVRIITPTGDGPPETFSSYVVSAVEEQLRMRVFEGVELPIGEINVGNAQAAENICSAIRRGHPQIVPQAIKSDAVALVCGGPSLESTLHELRDCIAEGAKVVTVNGSYQWCIDRNIIPSMQIVMDARPTNVRFLDPVLPRCHYALASQCHPTLWDAVEGRKNVWIFHVGLSSEEVAAKALLDSYYRKQWHGIGGGVTVGTRAISLLRTIGYLRFDIFGMDCCWMGDAHHAYPQAENEKDERLLLTIEPTDDSSLARKFECAPWHVKQFEGLLQMMRFQGNQYVLNLHGDGMAAYAMRASAGVIVHNHAASVP